MRIALKMLFLLYILHTGNVLATLKKNKEEGINSISTINESNDFQTTPQITISIVNSTNQIITEISEREHCFIRIELDTPVQVNTTIRVPYKISGTATSNLDYIEPLGVITIEAGESLVKKKLTVVNDNELEGDESIIFTFLPNLIENYQLQGSPVQTLIIKDTESLTIKIKQNIGTGEEVQSIGVNEGSVLEITVQLLAINENGKEVFIGKNHYIPFKINFKNVEPSEYSPLTIGTPSTSNQNIDIYYNNEYYVFTEGNTDLSLQVFLVDDKLIEEIETIDIYFEQVSAWPIDGQYHGTLIPAVFGDSKQDNANLNIRIFDNDEGIINYIRENVINGKEGTNDTNKRDVQLEFGLSATNALQSDITFQLDFQDKSATGGNIGGNGVDYNNTPITVIFTPGMDKKTVTVPIFNDTGSEETETFTFRVSKINSKSNIIFSDELLKPNEIRIIDSNKPTISMKLEKEGDEKTLTNPSILFEYEGASVPNTSVTIKLNYSGTATQGLDYGHVPEEKVIPPTLTGTNRVVIPILQDKLIEGIEYIEINASLVSDLVSLGNNYLKIPIIDREKIQIHIGKTTEGQEGENIHPSFQVVLGAIGDGLSSALPYELHIPFKITSSSIEVGKDITVVPFYITVKKRSKTATFQFNIIEDVVYEKIEVLDLELVEQKPYTFENNILPTVSLGITDIEEEPIVDFEVSGNIISEDNGTLLITIKLLNANNKLMLTKETVKIEFAFGGNATINQDFSFPNEVQMNPHTSSLNLILKGIPNNIQEGNESFTISIRKVENATIKRNTTPKTITIIENLDNPIAFLTVDKNAINENNDTANIDIAFPELANVDRTVKLLLGGSAIKNDDYIISQENVVIPKGEFSKKVSITSKNDAIFEDNDFVEVKTENVYGNNSIIIQINNDDPNPNLAVVSIDKEFALADNLDVVNIYVQLLQDNGKEPLTTEFPVTVEVFNNETGRLEVSTPVFDATLALYSVTVSTDKVGTFDILASINGIAIKTNKKIVFNISDIVPNQVLTPNNDKINDFWYIKGIDMFPNNIVKIYNFEGLLIWETSSYNNRDNYWTGGSSINNKLGIDNFSKGTFYYHLLVNGSNPIEKKGIIELIR